MDLSKKRKADENGGAYPAGQNELAAAAPPMLGVLSPEDIEKILEPFTKEQLVSILRGASVRHADVLESVRSVADADTSLRKLFVRGLGWETNTEKLRQVFSDFGELDEAIVITDKASGKSKGYGFVTFKHVDAAILALKEPNKKIDGRITVTQLASARNSGSSQSADVALRKIYVGNVPFEVSSEKLLNHFSMYGEVEEGPLGFDKQNGKAKGFAFFVYKTEEGARASLAEPMKMIEGHQVLCKLATDNKKGKQQNMGPGGGPGGMQNAGPAGMAGDGRVGSMPGSNYGVPGSGYGPYSGFSGGPGPGMQQPQPQPGMVHQGMPAGPGYGNQAPGSGGYGGPGGYGGAGGYGGGSGDYGAAYRNPQGGAGMPNSGGYPDGGNYPLQSGYPSQVPQPGAASRGPPGGMYQGMPPYY